MIISVPILGSYHTSTKPILTAISCYWKICSKWPKMAKKKFPWECTSPQNGQFFTFYFIHLFSPIALNGTFLGREKVGIFYPPQESHLERSERKSEWNKKWKTGRSHSAIFGHFGHPKKHKKVISLGTLERLKIASNHLQICMLKYFGANFPWNFS